MKKYLICLLAFMIIGCNLGAPSPAALATATQIFNPSSTASVEVSPPTATSFQAPTFTPPPVETNTPTTVPIAESLDATVVADLLSCRYGPGSEYLYLYGLKKGAKIKIIGQTGGNNWVMVEGKNKCWVNTKFIEIKGDPKTLKVVYPNEYNLPVSPYYSAPVVLSATRNGDSLTVSWSEVVLRAGDEEDESMFIYIIEVWRCEGGEIIFDPLASNYPEVTFVDETGCAVPSHGRVFFQEKHGFAGPAEISFPK